MKNIHLNGTKLSAYSSMAIALLSAENLQAQISYTDIEPNILIDHNMVLGTISEMIDMNNDGITDIEINSEYISTSSVYGHIIKANGKNATNVGDEKNPFGGFTDAKDVEYGTVISSVLPTKMQWKDFGYLFQFIVGGNDWDDTQEHYLPVRLNLSGNFNYGWLRLKVGTNGQTVEIMDYAYNTIINQSIIAGQTLGCADGFENNNTFLSAKPVATGHIYHALINVGTDKDFFKWTYTADPLKPNVQVSLLNLPKNYNLRLYDASKVLIATSANGGLTTEKIFYNNALANGTYYIKVYPKGTANFDAANCYSLQIESRNTPYPKMINDDEQSPEITSIKAFPNPAVNQVTFTKSSGFVGKLSIMDVSGREVLSGYPLVDQTSVSIDISNLPTGTYFARFTGADDVRVTKFVVQR